MTTQINAAARLLAANKTEEVKKIREEISTLSKELDKVGLSGGQVPANDPKQKRILELRKQLKKLGASVVEASDNTEVLKELDAVQDMLAKAIAYYAKARAKVAKLHDTGHLATAVGQAIKDAHTDLQILIEDIEEM